jgi:hypothetical protein
LVKKKNGLKIILREQPTTTKLIPPKMPVKISYIKLFYLILLLGLLARIYVAFFSGLGWYGYDTELYLKMAKGIVDGNPISFFPNGLPLLLAGIILLNAGSATTILVVLNIVMQLLVIIIIEKILTIYNVEEKVKLLTVLIVTFYPHIVSNVRFVYTECSSLFLIVLSIFLYTFKKYPASGFAGYLAYTFRPSLFLVLPIIVIYDFFLKKRKQAFKTALGFIMGIMLFTSLEWTGIVASPSNQYYNTLVSISGTGYDLDFKLKNFTEVEKKEPVKTYFNFLTDYPFKYIKQRIYSLWSLWGPFVPPTENSGIAGMVLHGLRFPAFILAVCAFLYRNKMKYDRDLILLLFFPIISVTLIHFLTFSSQRHQFTAEPFAVILSVLFIDYLIKLRRESKMTAALKA